jgi:hypothetical protein
VLLTEVTRAREVAIAAEATHITAVLGAETSAQEAAAVWIGPLSMSWMRKTGPP